MPRTGEVAVTASLALAAIAAGYALFSYLGPAGTGGAAESSIPRSSAEQMWSAVQTEPVGEPLRVANPFDASEIFEFPAGTSEADAREAVAGFLIDRATRRGVAGNHRHSAPKS